MKILCRIWIVLVLITFECNVCFSYEKKDSTTSKFFVEFHNVTPEKVETKNFWQDYFFPQSASIIALIVFIGGCFQFSKKIKETHKNLLTEIEATRTNLFIQIKETEKNIIKEKDLERVKILSDYIAKILYEIESSISKDGGKIANGLHCSETHCLLEKNIILYLNDSMPYEKELIQIIQKFKEKSIITFEDKKNWISNIEKSASNVIKNKFSI